MKANTTVMLQQASKMRPIVHEITELRTAVLQAGERLEGESISEQFYPLLAMQANKMEELAEDVAHLRQLLERIAETYQDCEKRIVDHVELDDQRPKISADVIAIDGGALLLKNLGKPNLLCGIRLEPWIPDRHRPGFNPDYRFDWWNRLVPRWLYPRPIPGPRPRPRWIIDLISPIWRFPIWPGEPVEPRWLHFLGGDI